MKTWRYLILLEVLILASILIGFISFDNRKLRLIACDIGQGDAILVTYGNNQILTDGGPNNRVLDCLSEFMPFWDRKIELVVLTHPDKDHFAGLIDVFKRYEVGSFLTTKAKSSSQEYRLLESIVGGSGVDVIYMEEGMKVGLGKIYLDILSPEEGRVTEKEDDLNALSIVSLLSFGNFKALLTGDVDIEGINRLVIEDKIPDVDYLKIPHHGSRNNITSGLIEASKPEIAVISVGKNSYGHPHKDVLEILNKYGVQTLRTDQGSAVDVTTDGQSWQLME